MAWRTTLSQSWLTRGPLALCLWPLSQIYGALQRRHARQSNSPTPHAPHCPVVVVGNVVAGGAGKTPLTIALAQALMARGQRPGIVSKGYGRQSRTACIDVNPHSDAREVGDEPLVMAQVLDAPVVVCSQRTEGIAYLLARHPDTTVVLCDDGLQDTGLHRDVEIVVFDERGVGNGWLLPAGPLREPWPRTPAAHVNAFVVQSCSDNHAALDLPGEHGPMWQVWRQLDGQTQRLDGLSVNALEEWRGKDVQAAAGIAKPEAFFQMLTAAGLHVVHRIVRPDHDPLNGLTAQLQAGLPLFTTAKDGVKLRQLLPAAWACQTWVVGLTLSLPDSLNAALCQAVQQRQSELSLHHG